MKVSDSVTLDIVKLNEDARGVAFFGSQRVLVADVIDGEKVQMGIVAMYDGGALGRIEKIIKPSEFRVKPKCPYVQICGGCNLQHMAYEKQLQFKKELVKTALSEFKNITINDTIGAYYPYEYRNKVHFVIGRKDNKTQIGFFEEGSKEIVDIDNCVLHDAWAQKLYNILKEYLKISKIAPYDIDEQTGLLRYVTARCLDNNIIVTAVVSKKLLPKSDVFYKLLKENFKKVSLYLNVNTRTDSLVYTDEFEHLYGEKTLNAKIMGVEVELFPTSFLQVNLPIMTKIYKQVIELAQATKDSVLIDLFSGIGITSVLFAKLGANVASIELEKSAVLEARRLIRTNNLTGKVNALEGDCNILLKQVMETLPIEQEKIIFVDPPRKGLEKTASIIVGSGAQKVIYLSCSPFSLAEDLKTLTKNYKIMSVTPYDMFPQTKHVETLVELIRK